MGDHPEIDQPSYEDGELFVLPYFSFPRHYLVQEWLNGTDKNDDFELTVTKTANRILVSALKPRTKQIKFFWKLRGIEKIQEEILDFEKE